MKPLVLAAAVAILLAPATALARHHGEPRAPRLPRHSERQDRINLYGGIMGMRGHGGHVHDVRSEFR